MPEIIWESDYLTDEEIDVLVRDSASTPGFRRVSNTPLGLVREKGGAGTADKISVCLFADPSAPGPMAEVPEMED